MAGNHEDENFRVRASKNRFVPVAEGNKPPDESDLVSKIEAMFSQVNVSDDPDTVLAIAKVR